MDISSDLVDFDGFDLDDVAQFIASHQVCISSMACTEADCTDEGPTRHSTDTSGAGD
jgi:hypothetical protein